MVKVKSATVEILTRNFVFGSLTLPDPDPDMTAEEVKLHYATQYPALLNAKTESDVKDNIPTFTFKTQTATLG